MRTTGAKTRIARHSIRACALIDQA
jgi:hypothetical protein